VTSFYTADSGGSRSFNFAEGERIYWYTRVINDGSYYYQTDPGTVHMNLYQNQETVPGITGNNTSIYIATNGSGWAPGVTKTIASYEGGSNRSDYENAYSFERTGAQTNNGEPLFARIVVDPADVIPDIRDDSRTNNSSYFRYTVGDTPDLQITDFHLRNSSGDEVTRFSPGNLIFPKLTYYNYGGTTAFNRNPNDRYIYTAFYSNAANTVTEDTPSDVDVLIRGPELNPNQGNAFWCRPDPGNRCTSFTNEQYWQINQAGRYTARVYVNYNDDAVEGPKSNNQMTIEYSVGRVLTVVAVEDLDGDGTKDANEDYLSGVRFRLYRNSGGSTYNTNIGSHTTTSTGTVEFDALQDNSYRVLPEDYPAAYRIVGATESILTLPPNATRTFYFAPNYEISGKVYSDKNQSNTRQSSTEPGVQNITVTLTGPSTNRTLTSDAQGDFNFTNLLPGTYSVTLTLTGTDYNTVTTLPQSVVITTANQTVNFGIFPKYSISGRVFIDLNEDKIFDTGEEYSGTAPVIQNNGSTSYITTNADGTYTISALTSGANSVTYTSLPTGYTMVHPLTGPPPLFAAQVGTSCATATPIPGGTCSAGNLINVNFAIKAGEPWIQAYGLDVRFDSGVDNPVPASPNAACGGAYTMIAGSGSTPGVLYTGNVAARNGQGNTSVRNWMVGGTVYPELFSPINTGVIRTSYGYVQATLRQSNITPTNLNTVCANINNCTLTASLPSGVYQANGNMSLNAFTVGADRDIVILANGNVNIQGAVDVPNTSTLTVISAGNIVVPSSIGTAASCPAPANATIEGFYSADDNFVLESAANCTTNTADLQLNVQGSIVVNADKDGGSFVNNRTLCTNNSSYPSFTIKERPDFILNAPDIIKTQSFIWEEVAP